MQRVPTPSLHPAVLPQQTVVGRWRVVAWAGRGVHGAVYRAVPVDNERASPVALKLALLPRDPRFAREAEMLSRLRHLSVPRLWEHGEWQHPAGTLYPFLIMEWIEGVPLYDWAQQHHPTSQQVLRLLAQLARALQALHAQGLLHRDLKGHNVLVRRTDGRAFLIDFGSGHHPGASTLTPDTLPPGTPAYRSPEAWLFALRFSRDSTARYSAGPADDLYALGVTAYRLVTGQYPELAEPWRDEAGTWHLGAAAPPPPLALNLRVDPQLNALILRMLSVRPEERGTAEELAEALEQAAERTVPENAQPLFAPAVPPPSEGPREEEVHAPAESPRARGSARLAYSRVHARLGWPWLVRAAAGLAVVAWAWWALPGKHVEKPSVVQEEAGGASLEDGGTAGLGDAASTASTVASPEPSAREELTEDTPPEPLPGQTRPDSKGRCPHKWQVALNGGCWGPLKLEREKCEDLSGHMVKGICYVPIISRQRQPTSSPAGKP
jgi:predicted Ser/Thr protein kinase